MAQLGPLASNEPFILGCSSAVPQTAGGSLGQAQSKGGQSAPDPSSVHLPLITAESPYPSPLSLFAMQSPLPYAPDLTDILESYSSPNSPVNAKWTTSPTGITTPTQDQAQQSSRGRSGWEEAGGEAEGRVNGHGILLLAG